MSDERLVNRESKYSSEAVWALQVDGTMEHVNVDREVQVRFYTAYENSYVMSSVALKELSKSLNNNNPDVW